jgi:D-aminopeptidase
MRRALVAAVAFAGVVSAGSTLSLPSDAASPLFQAALEATEEAVYNSLLRATPVTSALGSAEALPVARVVDVMRRYGRPAPF